MEVEKRILERDLGFASTPTRINESDLNINFNDFSRKIRCKWYFRNEPSENFLEKTAFNVKSYWNPPKGHPTLSP